MKIIVNKIFKIRNCDLIAVYERKCIYDEGWTGKYYQEKLYNDKYSLNEGINIKRQM